MTSAHPDYWNQPELSARIDDSIERHRKSEAVLRVTDVTGKPLAGVPVAVRQLDSSFHFGANIFMLDGFPSTELNRLYEERYCALFNGATVPFYWKTLEPEPDKLRFAADSPFLARRPPPDRVVDFCEEKGLRMHGHTLVWNLRKYSTPDWLPEDFAQAVPLWKKRIHEIAARYGKRIPRWDVLNERVANYQVPDAHPMPDNYEQAAFDWAGAEFPPQTQFDINEVTSAWSRDCDRYLDLIRRLLADGARIDGIGLQFHLFEDAALLELLSGSFFPPGQLLEALDRYGALQRPVHVSEITLTSPGNTPEGRQQQALAATSLYRLWFSHPSVRGITWWNVPDGGAAPDENKVFSGLIDAHLQPKPAYEALHHLIHHEWRTTFSGVTDADGCLRFRGFHGRYRASVAEDSRPGVSVEWEIQPGTGSEAVLVAKM